MEAAFWHERWDNNRIGFHEGEANACLVKHFDKLELEPGARVFVPLCGKSRDIAWLLSKGHRVVGAELSRVAIEQLFADLGVTPEIEAVDCLLHFRAADIDMFVGDIFDLSGEITGNVDGVYDRAALIALPDDMRADYATHVADITSCAPQLLISLEYDQSVMPGPPFSVDADELIRVHGARYHLNPVDRIAVEGGLKGVCPAMECVWMLQHRR